MDLLDGLNLKDNGEFLLFERPSYLLDFVLRQEEINIQSMSDWILGNLQEISRSNVKKWPIIIPIFNWHVIESFFGIRIGIQLPLWLWSWRFTQFLLNKLWWFLQKFFVLMSPLALFDCCYLFKHFDFFKVHQILLVETFCFHFLFEFFTLSACTFRWPEKLIIILIILVLTYF